MGWSKKGVKIIGGVQADTFRLVLYIVPIVYVKYYQEKIYSTSGPKPFWGWHCGFSCRTSLYPMTFGEDGADDF